MRELCGGSIDLGYCLSRCMDQERKKNVNGTESTKQQPCCAVSEKARKLYQKTGSNERVVWRKH